MDEQSSVTIYKTTNYNQFKFLSCNRQVKPRALEKMKMHILNADRLSANPILIDKDMNVIDGQHRLKAAMDLRLPIYYIQDDTISKCDITTLNNSQTRWTPDDYFHFFEDEEYSEYQKLKNFLREQSLSLNQFMKISSKKILGSIKNGTYKFMNPTEQNLFVQNLNQTNQIKELIKEKSFDSQTAFILRSTNFSEALMAFVSNEEVKFSEFYKNVSLLIHRFKKCASRGAYTELFKEIYNYKKRNKLD